MQSSIFPVPSYQPLLSTTLAVSAVATLLRTGENRSANRKGEVRRSNVLTGEIDLPPLPADVRLLLALASRCHVGRHTNEGLGMIAAQSPLD